MIEEKGTQIEGTITSYPLSNKRTLIEIDQGTELPGDCRVITQVASSVRHQLLLKLLKPDNEKLLDIRKNDSRAPQLLTGSGPMAYKVKLNSFRKLCLELNALYIQQANKDVKAAIPAVHGTPGLGKSAFLDHFANAVYNFTLDSSGTITRNMELYHANRDWLENCVVVSVTYNDQSPLEYAEEYQNTRNTRTYGVFASFVLCGYALITCRSIFDKLLQYIGGAGGKLMRHLEF